VVVVPGAATNNMNEIFGAGHGLGRTQTTRNGDAIPAGVAPGSRRFIRINRASSRRLAVTAGETAP